MDEIDRLLRMLPDEQSRQFARLRLEGYNNHEIARQLGCALRTVERRVRQIKERWAKEYGVRTDD